MTSSRRVLVVRVGAMGDVLHALPGVAALRTLWPEMVIDWVVDPRWAPLLVDEQGRGPVVSGVRLADTRLWSTHPVSMATTRSVADLWRTVRAGRYRTVVDVQGTLRSAAISIMAAGADRSGFADPRERAARLFYTHAHLRRGAHVVEQNAALLGEALGVSLQPQLPLIPVHPEAEAWAERLLAGLQAQGRTVLLAPGAGWGAKQWPAGHFGQLAIALRESGFNVLVNAAHGHDVLADEVVRASAGAATAVPCSVAQLIALSRRSEALVGGDSGPIHLGAALGRPVVALFGPTDPARNGPWGPGRMKVLRDPASITSYRRRPEPDPGLRRIPVKEVISVVHELTGASPKNDHIEAWIG